MGLVSGYWVLDSGFWMLVSGYLLLGFGCWISWKMAASMMPIWMMVVAHGWTDPFARGEKTIREQIM